MSIKVSLEELPTLIRERGEAVYVCTVSDPAVSHLSHTTATIADGRILCGAGGMGRRNADERPAVVLLWPSREPKDYSLIVDGIARVTADGLSIEPQSAVLHRPAGATD